MTQRRDLITRVACLALVVIAITALSVSSGRFLSPAPVKAQQPVTDTPYFSAQTVKTANGVDLVQYKINGPSTPPKGFEAQRQAVALPKTNAALGAVTLTVPAFNWVFGCSSVSGSMIAGYYDRNGFSNMYTGPTNGGVMPLDNSVWGTWSDGVDTYPNIPLAASHNGVDGRVTKGSIDDYWVSYGSTASDPYVTGAWTEHSWDTAIGDYMKTSQSAYGNSDGSTNFYNYTSSASPLTCSDMETYGISTLDGTYGRKLFYEARGYTVTDCYSQKTDNTVTGGFSFAQYKAEINAGRPVMLNLAGHTIVGVGYDDTNNTVYIHDTWDYLTHSMPWGGSYSGMQLLSVSIVNLAAPPTTPPGDFNKTGPANGATGVSTNPTLSWGASSSAATYDYCYDTTNDGACSNWTNTTATSVSLTGLNTVTTYYWHVRAKNVIGTTYSNANSFWSFTTTATSGPSYQYLPIVVKPYPPYTGVVTRNGAGLGGITVEMRVSTDSGSTWSTFTSGVTNSAGAFSLNTPAMDGYTEFYVRYRNPSTAPTSPYLGAYSCNTVYSYSDPYYCQMNIADVPLTAPGKNALVNPYNVIFSWTMRPNATDEYGWIIYDGYSGAYLLDILFGHYTGVQFSYNYHVNGIIKNYPYLWSAYVVDNYGMGIAYEIRSVTFNAYTSPPPSGAGTITLQDLSDSQISGWQRDWLKSHMPEIK